MHLDTLSFIYLFLPASVLLFYCTPIRFKRGMLLAISLFFYLLISPQTLTFMLVSLLVDFGGIWMLRNLEGTRFYRKGLYGLLLIKNIAIILVVAVALRSPLYLLPMGLLLSTLTSTAMLVDTYRGEIPYERNLVDFLLFHTFYGKMYLGPLVRYDDFMPLIKGLTPSLSRVGKGLVLFFIGLAKKVLLADNLWALYAQLKILAATELTVLGIWGMVLTLGLGIFFVFSSFSDMARGLSQVYCLDLPRNVYYPFQAPGLQAFLERFNSSYYHFIGTYFRLPEKWGKKNWAPAMGCYTSAIFMGFWFGVGTYTLAWGVFVGTVVYFTSVVFRRWTRNIPTFFRSTSTFFIAMFSFVFLAGDSLSQCFHFILGMFGMLGLDSTSDSVLYLITSNLLLVILGIVLSTNLVDQFANFVRKYVPWLADATGVVVNLLILIVVTAFLL